MFLFFGHTSGQVKKKAELFLSTLLRSIRLVYIKCNDLSYTRVSRPLLRVIAHNSSVCHEDLIHANSPSLQPCDVMSRSKHYTFARHKNILSFGSLRQYTSAQCQYKFLLSTCLTLTAPSSWYWLPCFLDLQGRVTENVPLKNKEVWAI